MASMSLQQLKNLQYKSQIIQSYIKKFETNLRAYNASQQFTSTEQFLALTKLKLQQIEKKIVTDRIKEQQLKLNNNILNSQINNLKKEVDGLYKKINLQESKTRKLSSNSSSNLDRRSQKNTDDLNERKIVETALHVIKGAIVKVLDIPTAKTTMSVHFSNKPWIGSITIGNCQNNKLYSLTENIKKEIQQKANEIIDKNVKCVIYKDLNRKDAEKQFGDEMYDFYPVPDHIQTLNVLEIKDWNINCTNKDLCNNTGELIALKIGKCKYNGSKKQLTVYFTVGPNAKES
eukprot:5514_1